MPSMLQFSLSPTLSMGFHVLAMVAVLFSHVDHISAESEMEGEGNETGECTGSYYCKKGVILPIWEPQDPSFGDKIARATVYFVAMVYMFLGVSIIADRFMSSIEVITSQEKEITIKKPNGETTKTTVRIWNETVSNLTLMALQETLVLAPLWGVLHSTCSSSLRFVFTSSRMGRQGRSSICVCSL